MQQTKLKRGYSRVASPRYSGGPSVILCSIPAIPSPVTGVRSPDSASLSDEITIRLPGGMLCH